MKKRECSRHATQVKKTAVVNGLCGAGYKEGDFIRAVFIRVIQRMVLFLLSSLFSLTDATRKRAVFFDKKK